MDVPSYASNIQPYGSQSGTKLASENNDARSISAQRLTDRSETLAAQEAERNNERRAEAADAAEKQTKERQRISEEQMAQLAEQMKEFVDRTNRGLAFRVDKESGREVMTIYEASTGDVIRQIPEEEMLEVLRRLAKEYDHRTGLVMTQV